ncbi:MAG: tetratricopeptide repeat protein [Chitinivibrionales bacterium]|nr:tetratricopeptide repeat protein [Chitinivibrionales bacterium]
MDIKVSKKKQEMRKDPLVDGMVRAKGYLNEKRQSVTIAAVVVLLVALGVVFYTQMRNTALRRADETFGKAVLAYTAQDTDLAVDLFTETANEHKGTPHAAYGALMLGSHLLEQGRYEEALAWYEDASESRNSGFVAAAALEGIAAAHEGLGDFQQAQQYLRRALEDNRLDFRKPTLRWKLALVNRKLNETDEAVELCEDIVSDSLAMPYHQKARNMLAALKAGEKS